MSKFKIQMTNDQSEISNVKVQMEKFLGERIFFETLRERLEAEEEMTNDIRGLVAWVHKFHWLRMESSNDK